MKNKLALSIFGIILVLAFLGGTWGSSVYAQTVPPAPPAPAAGPVVPVAGANAVTQIVVAGKPVNLTFGACAKAGVEADILKAGQVVSLTTPTTLPGADTVSLIGCSVYSSVLDNGVPATLTGNETFTFTFPLTDAQVQALKKDPTAGILWYNSTTNKWERLIGVLEGNNLTFTTYGLGYFALGGLK